MHPLQANERTQCFRCCSLLQEGCASLLCFNILMGQLSLFNRYLFLDTLTIRQSEIKCLLLNFKRRGLSVDIYHIAVVIAICFLGADGEVYTCR